MLTEGFLFQFYLFYSTKKKYIVLLLKDGTRIKHSDLSEYAD